MSLSDSLESFSANVEREESSPDAEDSWSSSSSSLYDSNDHQEIEQIIKEETEKDQATPWWDIGALGIPINMPSFFCGALVFYALAALVKNTLSSESELLVRKPPLPRPFFPANCNINDYYNGSFGRPYDMYNRADISLTFFYASWSLHSREAKREFIKLSQLLNNTNLNIKLNGVNCDTGYCKQLYKVHNYPAILAVTTGGIPVFYEDVPVADKMFSWLLRLSKPMHRLESLEDKNYDDTRYDLIVLAYLKVETFGEPSREFKVFRAAALKANNPRIGFFYTINGTLAERFGIREHGIFKIGSKSYRIGTETLSQAVLDTINTHVKEIEGNVVMPLRTELKESEGLLSTQLFDMMNRSRIGIVLFTLMSGEFETSENVETLRKIVFEYYKCGESEEPVDNENELARDLLKFSGLDTKCKIKDDVIGRCCSRMKEQDQCGLKKVLNEDEGTSEKNSVALKDENESCPELNFLNKNSLKNFCCRKDKPLPTVPHNIIFECYNQKAMEKLGLVKDTTLPPPKAKHLARIRGKGCFRNHSIQFIAADKRFTSYFSRVWNLNDRKFGFDKDKIVVISMEQEVIKEIELKKNWLNVIDFLSHVDVTTLGTMHLDEKKRQSQFSNIHDDIDEHDNPLSRPSKLIRLDSETFRSLIVSNPNRTHSAVVFFSGGSAHGQSMAVTYIIHAVKQEFLKFESLLQFYIIDTSRNSLPYSYDFDALPTIVFFPAFHNSHLQVAPYPAGLPITVPNLLAFLISRASPELKWRLALRSCKSSCLQRNRRKLLKFDRLIRDDIRTIKLTKHNMLKNRVVAKHFALLLKRRKLQLAAAHYLLNVLRIIQDNEDYQIEEFESVESHSLLIRYLLSNNFGYNL